MGRGRSIRVSTEVGEIDDAAEDLMEDPVIGLHLLDGRQQCHAAEPVDLVNGGRLGEQDGRCETSTAFGCDGNPGSMQCMAEGRGDLRKLLR